MFDDNLILNIVSASGILIAASLLAWIVNQSAKLAEQKLLVKKGASNLSITIDSTIKPIVILIIVEGIILALLSVTSLQTWKPGLELAQIGAIIVIATYGSARIFESLLVWQLARMKDRSKKPIDDGIAMFFRRIAQLMVYAVGLLLLLDYLGIPISPLIASLGIGGLAVALALQPTLSNFFAGVQVVSDRVARVNDFIEIDENTRGYVTDVGWRSTRIRTATNNIIIIPNSILANSQVINYNMPNTALAVKVYCGVSYDSDLAHVRKVALEVANEVIEERYDSVKTFEPFVVFDDFGDSNIMFWIWIQANDRLSSFYLKSELIIRLHERFKKENITINYPVRTTYIKWPSENLPISSQNSANTELEK